MTNFQVIDRDLTELAADGYGGDSLGQVEREGTIYDVALESIAPVVGRLAVINKGQEGNGDVVLATIEGLVVELTSVVEDRHVSAGDVISLVPDGENVFSGHLKVTFQQAEQADDQQASAT